MRKTANREPGKRIQEIRPSLSINTNEDLLFHVDWFQNGCDWATTENHSNALYFLSRYF